MEKSFSNSFKEEDKQKMVQFLNMIAKHAKFDFSLQETLDFVKLLGHMQSEILKKIDSHVFEIKKVIEQPQPEENNKSKRGRPSKKG